MYTCTQSPLPAARAARARGGRSAARPARARAHPRRPARAHDRVGRQGDGRGDGPAPHASSATSTWRSATTRRNVRVVPGLDADDIRRQAEEIAAANELLAPFRILRGSECDILPDGSLDLPDDVLAELEWVQISLHAGQRWGRQALTDRVLEAMHHPAASCLSHPKGRILNHRPENALDLERVFEVALETGVALEVNGLPDRLDLSAGRTSARRSPPASRSSARPTPTRCAGSGTWSCRSRPRGAAARRVAPCSTRSRWRSSYAADGAGAGPRRRTRAPRTSACSRRASATSRSVCAS